MNTRKLEISRWANEMLTREFVVFDFETTGLDTQNDRIVQVGIIDHTGKTLVDTLVNPCVHIPPEATHVHGITNAQVADAPTYGDVYPALFEALDDKVWVAYNIRFDEDFLVAECSRNWVTLPKPPKEPAPRDMFTQSYCAMNRYAAYWGERRYGGGYRWQRLTDACYQQGIQVNGAHSALGDCLLTLELIRKMAGAA